MKKIIKEKWLKALRSGKYKQGTGCLLDIRRNNDRRFCCLGVLCDIYSKEKRIKWEKIEDENGRKWGIYKEHGILPTKVAKWAGVAENPEMKVKDESIFSGTQSLAELNDEGKKFTTIAKIIEEQL